MHMSISWLKALTSLQFKIQFLQNFWHKQIGLSEALGNGLEKNEYVILDNGN